MAPPCVFTAGTWTSRTLMLTAHATMMASAMLMVLAVSGCGRKAPPNNGPPPAAFNPQQFPDVPIPRGYAPLAGSEQLAVSYANGAVRRYLGTYSQVLAEAVTDEELKAWFDVRLAAQGWRLTTDRWPTRQEWSKPASVAAQANTTAATEMLRIEVNRSRGKTLLRITVAPQISGTAATANPRR